MSAVRIGVISDTHIPDRAAGLHPALLEELRNRQVDLILHAGDISVPGVLRTLEEIAPVKAVRGNRDILFPGGLPNTQEMTINGVPLVLTHGHLNFLTYWWDKLQYIFRGYERRRFTKRLGEAFPLARVIVYGHTHRAENVSLDEKLFFNPGSAAIGDLWVRKCSFGLLEIEEDGSIKSQLVPLEGFHLVNRRWEPAARMDK